jgi:hypothetical protein
MPSLREIEPSVNCDAYAAPHPKTSIANKKRNCYSSHMGEGRKRVLLIAAAILVARKLSNFDGGKEFRRPAAAITDAVRWAEELLRAIDDRWPIPMT